MIEQSSALVEAGDLAAIAEAGIHRHSALLTHGSTQQQLAQIIPEHANTLDIRLFLGLAQDLGADGRLQQTLETVIHRLPDLLAQLPGGITLGLAEIIINLLAAALRIGIHRNAQEAFVLRPQNSQQAVGRHFIEGIGPVEIAAVLVRLRPFRFLGNPGNNAARAENLPQILANLCSLAQALGDNVSGAGKGGIGILHLPRLHKTRRLGTGITRLKRPHGIRQRLQPQFFRHGGTRAPLRPVRQIQVLQLG